MDEDKIYNFQRHQYLLKENELAFHSIGRPENADKLDDGLIQAVNLSRMASELDIKPFILTEEQKNELMNVDVDIDELGELHFPFDNFCIEMGDGESFLPSLEKKYSLDKHELLAGLGGVPTKDVLNSKLIYIMREHDDSYIMYDVADYQLQRMNEIRRNLKREENFPARSIDYMTHCYKITISNIEKTIRDIKESAGREYKHITKDEEALGAAANAVSENLEGKLKFLYVFCKYLESDNVELVRKLVHLSPNKNKQKEMKKRGMADILEILEPRVILTNHQQKSVAMHIEHGEGAKHSFMYDVRGHFKKIKIGRLAGRHIWCPPHRRGLANTTYRPAIRKIE